MLKVIKKNRMKDLRIKSKLSRFEAGIGIKKSEDCIQDIENGERKIYIDEAFKFAKMYGVSVEEIFKAKNESSEL